MKYAKLKKKRKNTKLPQIEPTLNCLALCVYQFFSVLFSFLFLHLHFAQRNVNETFHATGFRVQEVETELSGNRRRLETQHLSWAGRKHAKNFK